LLSPGNDSFQVDILFGVIGLAVGSFLNVLAIRTLKEESLFIPLSQCPKCKHQLGLLELLPVFSYFWLKGKCKHCQRPIAWYYPFVEALTAILFVIIIRYFGTSWYGLGMLVFVSTLIAVSITDFMEKLIPHEITYPAMVAGIIFSVSVRHDFWTTLAGIGISYILIDFMAFYGLKVYLWLHAPSQASALKHPASAETQGKPPSKKTVRQSSFKSISMEPPFFFLRTLGKGMKETTSQEGYEEEIEVIGGGDAVLYALVSAWLGLNRLIFTLMVSFLIGAIMGAAYLLHDMYQERALHKVVRPILIGVTSVVSFVICVLAVLAKITQQPIYNTPWPFMLPAAVACGSLFGIIWVGSKFSKPFPFGPAIAVGAVMAMFSCPFAQTGSEGT
jgi:prepilin signal peptidase PulO-like enzyme (type II secretory pathway)